MGLGAEHVREVFVNRMGFSERETVALIGGHTVGRCHYSRSDWDGPWDSTPTVFDNTFYTLLMDGTWELVKDYHSGADVYIMKGTPNIMLPTDYCIKTDPEFAKYGRMYADNQNLWFKDFALAFKKLTELGCPWHGELVDAMKSQKYHKNISF